MTNNLNIEPDINLSVKQTFRIQSDMEVKEFSKKNEEYFGLVEIEENLRIMGKILGNDTPVIEQVVHVENCSFVKTPEFTFKLISN